MFEIERKFLVKETPDLSSLDKISYERYFLKIEDDFEDRIQRKGDKFEREQKITRSNLTRDTKKFKISEDEFSELKENSTKSIVRDSYLISSNPEITIKVYHGDFEGLQRAEVEFKDESEAKSFTPPNWFGQEITNSNLGKDSKLIKLSKPEFKQLLDSFQ